MQCKGNHATKVGGIAYNRNHCTVSFNENSLVTFLGNRDKLVGGVSCFKHSDMSFKENLSFKENSKVLFKNNGAEFGGAIYFTGYLDTLFDDNSLVVFLNNEADAGGAMYFTSFSTASVNGNTRLKFTGNNAITNGGSVYSEDHSNISFVGHSIVTFNVNEAIMEEVSTPQAILVYISVLGNTSVSLIDSCAVTGGAV